MDIVLYSTHCPRCNAIESILKEKKIEFILEDNKEKVESIAEEKNYDFAPFAIIDGVWYNTKILQEWVKNN